MRFLMVFILLITILTASPGASPVQAAVDLTRLNCLGELTAGTITRLDRNLPTKQVKSAAFFNTLSSLRGNNIWVGYEKGGWNIQGTKTWESVIAIQPQGYQNLDHEIERRAAVTLRVGLSLDERGG